MSWRCDQEAFLRFWDVPHEGVYVASGDALDDADEHMGGAISSLPVSLDTEFLSVNRQGRGAISRSLRAAYERHRYRGFFESLDEPERTYRNLYGGSR